MNVCRFKRVPSAARWCMAALIAIAATAATSSAVRATQCGSRVVPVGATAAAALANYHLKSIVVRVTCAGETVFSGALGESMPGVPATPAMHFRNGAMAFTYMSTLLLELVDQKRLRLDDTLATYFPELPYAGSITLKNLANMTSGYADYVYTPDVLNSLVRDPFRQWTSQELIAIGTSKPMMFRPGSNWGYSHTNYVILGRVLEKVTGMPLAAALQQYVLAPMNLTQTQGFDTPQIPEPALHAYSSERRADLGIPAGTPFYEESTYWNPSWTTAQGAVETTTIADLTTTMEAVGNGKLLSKASTAEQIGGKLIGFGHIDPRCKVCRAMTKAFNYGLGVVNLGPWITQTKSFAGGEATVGYLPAQKVALAVVATYAPQAFDAQGNYIGATQPVFAKLANAFAPGTLAAP